MPPSKIDELIAEVRRTGEAADRASKSADDISKKLNTSRRVQIALGVLMGLMAIVVGVLIWAVSAINSQQDSFRSSVIDGCERNNQFRVDVLAAFDQNDQDFAETLAQFAGRSPEDAAEFLELLRGNRDVPESLLPVDCTELYG